MNCSFVLFPGFGKTQWRCNPENRDEYENGFKRQSSQNQNFVPLAIYASRTQDPENGPLVANQSAYHLVLKTA
jgi:hypothetical protein